MENLMAKSSPTKQLAELVKQLQIERDQHLDAITVIDQAFADLGIPSEAEGGKRRRASKTVSRKKVAKKSTKKKSAKKRVSKKTRRAAKRRSFAQTADEFVLGLLKGGKKMTRPEINGRWKQAKRGGSPDNTLSKLSKAKTLKKEPIAGGRGSRYRLG